MPDRLRAYTERPRVVFFDIGQTLVTGTNQSARTLFAERLSLSDRETKRVGRLIMVYRSFRSAEIAGAISKLLPERDPVQIASHLTALWHEQEMSVKESPGATALVRSLKSIGLKVGVISNTWHPFYRGFLRACPRLASLLDFRIVSYRAGCKKPSTRIFRDALSETGVPAFSCWMIGDSYELDIEPALKIGMHAIWLLCRPEKEIPFLAKVLRGEKRSPDSVVENLHEILPFFVGSSQGGIHA